MRLCKAEFTFWLSIESKEGGGKENNCEGRQSKRFCWGGSVEETIVPGNFHNHMGILPMTLAWSYFGIWAVRFFFLWTLVYAENRNLLGNVSGHMYNSLKYEIHYKWDGMGWRKIEKGGSMCVNFLCRSVLTF